jgi:thiamine-phosphate pyrophosphorylase
VSDRSIAGLYVLVDPEACVHHSAVDVAVAALEGGAAIIQWRDKRRDALPQLEDLAAFGARRGGRGILIVNDRVDVALAARADGAHLGQTDLPLTVARGIVPASFIVGVSTNTVEEAQRAERQQASYVAVGDVFGTSSKGATRRASLERVREIGVAVSLPIVAIGGINASNIGSVLQAGAAAAAVLSAVCGARDPRAATAGLVAAMGERA